MGESYRASIAWKGSDGTANNIMALATSQAIVYERQEQHGEIHLTFQLEAPSLQSLRDLVDEILVQLAEVEEGEEHHE